MLIIQTRATPKAIKRARFGLATEIVPWSSVLELAECEKKQDCLPVLTKMFSNMITRISEDLNTINVIDKMVLASDISSFSHDILHFSRSQSGDHKQARKYLDLLRATFPRADFATSKSWQEHIDDESWLISYIFVVSMNVESDLLVAPLERTKKILRNMIISLDQKSKPVHVAGRLIKKFDNIDLLNPKSYQDFFEQGKDRYRYTSYSEALKEFDRAEALKQDQPGIYEWRGRTKKLMEDYQGALDDFKMANSLEPDDAYYREMMDKMKLKIPEFNDYNLEFDQGVKLFEKKQYRSALRYFNTVAKSKDEELKLKAAEWKTKALVELEKKLEDF